MAAKKSDPAVALEYLRSLEFSGHENGGPVCPSCKCQPALDPANPREWETHAEDCAWALAVAALS